MIFGVVLELGLIPFMVPQNKCFIALNEDTFAFISITLFYSPHCLTSQGEPQKKPCSSLACSVST